MLILLCDAFDASMPRKLERFGEVTSDMARLGEAEVVLVRSKTKCTREFIDKAPKLKLIIRGGVGIDNIDKAYAESKGIIVHNTPKSSAIAVAELTFSLMLSVPNHLLRYHNGLKEGQWLKKEKRTELYGKTLCLFGIGHIGSEVALRAKAFGMNVVAYDMNKNKTSPYATIVASPEVAVKDADYISLHIPLTDETRGMINKTLLDHCEKKPVVINTCRALVVNEADMIEMLHSGQVAWYCTDVWPSDPPAADDPLLKEEHVTFTPHVGANSEENLLRIGNETCDLLEQFQKEGKI